MTTQKIPLPELSAERIDDIEQALFDRIGRDRSARSARRGRLWLGAGAAAAVVVIAAVAAPSIAGGIQGSSGDAGSASDQAAQGAGLADQAGSAALSESAASDAAAREMITTASASVQVDDPAAAAREIGDAATARGGFVESMSISRQGEAVPVDPRAAYDTMPYPASPDGAWISVRIPSDQLSAALDDLDDIGEVTASSIDRQDVTDQAIDLRARVDATRASVDRLTELMAQAGSLSDLITAETALSDRQAMLESYQQQLDQLEGQVAMSTLMVTLSSPVAPVEANPAGFGDGLLAGWNGLVATLNGVVVALGFLLPWLAIAALAWLLVWGILRLTRRRRRGTSPDAS